MKIYLIRHGESTGDIENRYGGSYDDSLTEKGRQQAVQLAEELQGKGIEEIFSSPLIRAHATTSELHRKLRCKIRYLPNTRERNFYGILTGMQKDEALQKHPDLVAALEDRNNTLPDGESYKDFSSRVASAWEEIINSDSETVAVVTHAGPIRCIFRDVIDLGELGSIGDCSYVCVSDEEIGWKIVSSKGIQTK